MAGKVYFVGAGPGDPLLITVRGRQLLERADVVLYDYLATPELLEFAREDCEAICLGKHGESRLWTLEEIARCMKERATAGQVVVRLKGGDPSVFARLGEELQSLIDAGVEYEIVPGITSALGAAAYADVDLTHREWASAVAFVTGQETPEKSQEPIDYEFFARFPGTLAIYMGVTTVSTWSEALMRGGRGRDTPVVLVRHATRPDQETYHSTLGEVATLVDREHIRPPVVFLVGDAARKSERLGWFLHRPLLGRRVLVTRPRHQAGALVAGLRERGACAAVHPVIEIGPPPDPGLLDDTLRGMHEYDWVVFSSANGVRAVAERMWSLGLDGRALGTARLAAIGPGTAQELQRYRLRADLVPAEFRAESLAAALAPEVAQRNVLLIRASRGRQVLARQLSHAGARVREVVAYSSNDVETADSKITGQIANGEMDWVTVTSSAIARGVDRLWHAHLHRTKLASISPITSATLRELGWEPAAEATTYTMEGLVQAIVDAENKDTGSKDQKRSV